MDKCQHGITRAACAICLGGSGRRATSARAATGVKTNFGRLLNEEWGVGARHALYHRDGTWFMPLERFPGAYFDPNGYVLFATEDEYLRSPYLVIGVRVSVRGGIESMPTYVRVRGTSSAAPSAAEDH